MSTSPTPTTPPAHGSPENKTVDPTLAMIALMQQSLQKNATMIAQLNYCPSPHPPQPQYLSYQFKPQCPPFPKWDGTLPTITMLIEQIETYKAEAFYAGVHDWNQTTPTNRQLSVTISSDMMYSLPSSISSMFLNDARFASDRIAMLSSLLTHLKPSSNENLLISI